MCRYVNVHAFHCPIVRPSLAYLPTPSQPTLPAPRPGESCAGHSATKEGEEGNDIADNSPIMLRLGKASSNCNFNFDVEDQVQLQVEDQEEPIVKEDDILIDDDEDDAFLDEFGDDGEGWVLKHEVPATPLTIAPTPARMLQARLEHTDALTAQQFVKRLDAVDSGSLWSTDVVLVAGKPGIGSSAGAACGTTPSPSAACVPDGSDDVSNCSEPSLVAARDNIVSSSSHNNIGDGGSGSIFSDLDFSLLLMDEDDQRVSPIENASPLSATSNNANDNSSSSNNSNDDSNLSLIEFQVRQTSTPTLPLDNVAEAHKENNPAYMASAPMHSGGGGGGGVGVNHLKQQAKVAGGWRRNQRHKGQRLSKASKRGSRLKVLQSRPSSTLDPSRRVTAL